MSTIWFPGAIAGLQPTTGDGKVYFDTDGSIFIDRVWKCAYANAFSLCPKPRDAAPVGTPGQNNFCITSGFERDGGDSAKVTATYQGIWYMPFTVYQMDASRYERPITYHPKFNNASVFGDKVGSTSSYAHTKVYRSVPDPVTGATVASVFDKFLDISPTNDSTDPNCKFRGIEAYMVATATWRKTSYQLQPDCSLSNIFKLDAPETGGIVIPDGGNAGKSWLKADKTCRNMFRGASQVWEIQESWLYNANGWLSEIYA